MTTNPHPQRAPSLREQIDMARQRIAEWPQWMQDAARVASASFPKPAPHRCDCNECEATRK